MLIVSSDFALSLKNYLSTASGEEGAVVGAVLGAIFTGIVGISLLFSLAILVLDMIANWKVFTKMGEAGWKSLIPFYRDYILWGKVWNCGRYFVYLVLSLIIYIIVPIAEKINTDWQNLKNAGGSLTGPEAMQIAMPALILCVVVLIIGIFVCILDFKFARRLAKSFNQGTLFAIGIFFFPTLFSFILGFGNFSYIGNQSDTFKK